MRIGVPKEVAPNERRVAVTPDVAGKLVKSGHEVVVERGAGSGAFFPDEAYAAAGANQPYGRGLWRPAQWHKSCNCYQVLDQTFRTALER